MEEKETEEHGREIAGEEEDGEEGAGQVAQTAHDSRVASRRWDGKPGWDFGDRRRGDPPGARLAEAWDGGMKRVPRKRGSKRTAT